MAAEDAEAPTGVDVEAPAEAPAEAPIGLDAEAELTQIQGVNVAGTLEWVADKFLTQSHYTKIHQTLSKDWDRLQSLTAALKLMERYGVAIDREEEEKLASFDEDRQIEALVMKMPQQSKDEFQQFFLQLQVLVATATKVRHALEQGRPDDVESILNAADPGITPYVLRMAIVQAGAEVVTRNKQLHVWGKDRATAMGRNIRGQEDAISVSKKLQEAKRQLTVFSSSQNDKSKKVIMNFLNNNTAVLKAACFKGWSAAVKTDKMDRELEEEYGDKIEKLKAKLLELKSKGLEGIKSSMGRQANSLQSELVKDIFALWHKEVAASQAEQEREFQKQALSKELENAKADHKRKTIVAIGRMNGQEDAALQASVFSAWLTFHADYQKELLLEEEVKAKEASIQEHIKSKGENAKKLLTSTIGSTDSGLIQIVFQGWSDVLKEGKEEARMSEILNGAESKFASFGERGKKNGMNAMDKATYYLDMMHLIRSWNAWKLDTRMEQKLRLYHGKIEGKRRQLIGVQEMFRTFANKLEDGLKQAGADSTREHAPQVLKGRGLSKSESSVNLPDIHRKTQVSTASHSYNPQARHAIEGGHQGADRSRPSKVAVDKSAAYPSH